MKDLIGIKTPLGERSAFSVRDQDTHTLRRIVAFCRSELQDRGIKKQETKENNNKRERL